MTLFYIALGTLVLFVCLVLFFVAPAAKKHPRLELLRGRYIAHRGLHDIYPDTPENSLAAFGAAAREGFAVEIDIHLTRDEEVVVFHDDDLYRMCGVHGRPEEMTLDALKALRLKGGKEQIPTLSECLQTLDGRVPLLIEFKCKSGSPAPLCRAADRILSEYKGEYFVQSFYPFVLGWYKKHRKDVCRGQLASAFKKDKLHMRMLGCLLFNFLARPHFVSYEFCHAKHPMRKLCTKMGAFPVGWTFKSKDDVSEYGKYFDTYIFENFLPDR